MLGCFSTALSGALVFEKLPDVMDLDALAPGILLSRVLVTNAEPNPTPC